MTKNWLPINEAPMWAVPAPDGRRAPKWMIQCQNKWAATRQMNPINVDESSTRLDIASTKILHFGTNTFHRATK